MKSKWIIQGKVTTGAQKAAYFTQLDWVVEQCREKLGFKPFPGTLNLEIDHNYLSIITEIQKTDSIELAPPEKEGCSGRVIPISVGEINGAIIIPEDSVNVHGKNILEVMAPVGLRENYDLIDGQKITLFVDKPGRTKLQAVIFDLDGTLLDSVGIYYQIVNSVLSKLGYPKISINVMSEAVNRGDFDWQLVLPEAVDVTQPEVMDRVHAAVAEVYQPMFENEAVPIAGMKETIIRLSDAGLKLAIVTSTPRENVDFKLNQLKLNDTLRYFDLVLTSDDAPRKKPAPDPMIECCNQLGVALDKSVYIGDSLVDIQSGRTAGMKTIAVLTGFDDLDTLCKEHPDAVINSIAELKSIIDY